MPPTPCLHHIPASLTHGTQTQQGWGGPPTTAGAHRVPQLPSWGLRQGKVGNRKATVKSHLEQLVGPTNAFPFSEKGDFLGMWSTILSASCVYCDLAKRNSREHATHMATCHRTATFPDHVTFPPSGHPVCPTSCSRSPELPLADGLPIMPPYHPRICPLLKESQPLLHAHDSMGTSPLHHTVSERHPFPKRAQQSHAGNGWPGKPSMSPPSPHL